MENKWNQICAYCGVKTEHARLKHINPIKNSSRLTDLFQLVPLLLIRESRWERYQNWATGYTRQMGWFFVFPVPAVSFNFQNRSFIPPSSWIPIFLEDPLWNNAHVHGATQLEVCLFCQCSSCHIHKEYYRHTEKPVVDFFLAWFYWVTSYDCVQFWRSS
jgi:hypothetical protein